VGTAKNSVKSEKPFSYGHLVSFYKKCVKLQAKFRNTISAVYSNQWLVGNLVVQKVFKTEGACCHAV